MEHQSKAGKAKKWANESGDLASNLDKIKNVSVKDLLLILQQEQEAKTQLEDLLLQFQDENTKLKAQLSVYKSRVEQQQHELNKLSSKQNATMNRTMLDDDKALEIIELTLYKYQNFLDFLRNAGFGKLIDIGEMNQDKKSKSKHAEVIKQQKKLFKEKIGSGSLPKSPKKPRSKSPTDQQKYFLAKINETKSKMSRNYEEVYNSSRIEADSTLNESHDIDTLLSNALEISRTYRRFNSSSINNSTMYNQRRNNEMMLSEIEETNKENSNLNESELPSFSDVAKISQAVLVDTVNRNGEASKAKKQAITTTSLDEEVSEQLRKSSSSISPGNTIINNSAPKVAVRTSLIKNSLSESCDKEIEVEDVSEILSEDESQFQGKQYLKSKESTRVCQ
ncbi:centrosomal of 78 kDa-like [Brachionus plicatilis]|uniref:Centrosomal of 78 kDa-like n=1 Tax=Brachionus plicatilis TaxID=10195 RepID=A0A3M7PMC7_BRAPC|nr:centrosomal of 78 kDa-like [Brachionus plicatilis]